MSDFSLAQALELLSIDPFPTKEYRGIVNLLKNIKVVVEEASATKVCYVGDILKKLTIPPPEDVEDVKTRFIPSAEVHELLSQMQVSSRINALLIKLLRYLIIKLNSCTSDDAASILYDFKELRGCVFAFRDNSFWDKPRLDEIIEMFVKKLIKMVREMNAGNWTLKFHLYQIMRVMLAEFGKHPVYGVIIAKQLLEEVKEYKDKVDALDPDQEVDVYAFEVYFTHLYTLNEIVDKNLVDGVRERGDNFLQDLRGALDALAQKKTSPREGYLLHNLLKVIDVYLSLPSMTHDS